MPIDFHLGQLTSLLQNNKRVTRIDVNVTGGNLPFSRLFCVLEFSVISCDEALHNAEEIVERLQNGPPVAVWHEVSKLDRDQR